PPAATTAAAAARATAPAGGGAAGSAGSVAGAGVVGGATGSAGAARGGQRRSLPLLDDPTPQQLCEWVLQQARPGGGGFGFLRTAQRRQHSQQETFSPQVLSELFPQRFVTGSVETTALGAIESVAALVASDSGAALGARASPAIGPSSAEALHTFTLDSGASRCFFCDCTTLTPLPAPVPVSLADTTRGPVVARASSVLPCLAVPSGSLSGLHLPTFSTNLVSNAAIQDVWVDTFIPGGQRVAICTCSRTGRHLTTFTRRPGSSLYTLTTASAQVAKAGQVAASSQVSASGQLAASCSCRVLSHQTLLWHHRLGHPSLPCLRGMHSRLLVSGLPRSLPSLPRSPAPPCLPCVEGRQRAAPHSSEFPPTTAPLQTLHMDVWGPAPVGGMDQERYFLLLGERFRQDFLVLRLHSDRGGEFSSDLLAEFCRDEGIVQSFTLPASPQQNGIAERRIGLIMEVSHTSMIHAAAPHFLWSFAVGNASVFRVWGALSLVRDTTAGKLSPHTLRCVFLCFPTDAPPWQFYHPCLRRVFSSHDVTFDESVCYYRLHPHASHPVPLAPLFLVSLPPPVRPPPPAGSSSLRHGGHSPLSTLRDPPWFCDPAGGPGAGQPPQPDLLEMLSPQAIRVWIVRRGSPSGGGHGTAGAGAASPGGTGGPAGGAGVAAIAGGTRGAAGAGGARATSPRGATSAGGAGPPSLEGTAGAGGAGGSAGAGGAGAGGTGAAGAAGPGGARTGGAGAAGAGGAVRSGGATGAAGSGGTGGTAGAGGAGGAGAGGTACAGGAGGATGGAGSGGAGGTPGAGGTGAGGTGGAGAAGPGGARTRGAGAARAGGVAIAEGAGGATRATGTGGAGRTTGARGPGAAGASAAAGAGGTGGAAGAAGAGGAGATGAGGAGAVGTAPPRPFFYPHPQSSLPPPDSPQLLPGSPLPVPAPHIEVTESLTECREPETRASTPIVLVVSPVLVLLLSQALTVWHFSDLARAASPNVTRLLATAVTDPDLESTSAFALVTELVDIAARSRLDYVASLVTESESVCPPFVEGELALGSDVLEDRQFELECLAAALPCFASMLLCPEGDPDALDIPTPCSYAEAITGEYSSQWQTAMDAEMASWNSTCIYVDEVPPPRANIVDGMWIFIVKRPTGSPLAFKARYVARGFSQRQGVDFFQTFSPTPKMTTLCVLLHVAAQHDYELHSLDFPTTFQQGSLHKEIWLHRPPGFTGTTLAALGFAPSSADPSLFLRTDTTLPPFYVLVYVDDLVFATADTEALALVKAELHERHNCTDLGELRSYLGLQITRDRARRTITLNQSHMVHQVLQRFAFQFSSPQPTPLSTGHSLSAPPSDESVEPSGPYPELVGCLMYLMTCTLLDLAYPLSLLARYVAPGRHRKVNWDAAKRVLRYLCSTSGMGLMLGGQGSVVLTGHSDASWADNQATQRSSQGYTFSLGSGSVSWRSTRSSSMLSSSCEAEIFAGAMAAQELRWLTYLLTDLGERPRSPPVLYVDNKQRRQLRLSYVASRANTADVFTKALGSVHTALCHEQRLEHRTKHIALRYFLARELQQRRQLRLSYVASWANTADVFTKALGSGDHQRFCTALGLVPTLPHLLVA
ncbi:unnamed protein product, partial [Closterium sp. NIES-53]